MCGCRGDQSSSGGVWGPCEVSCEVSYERKEEGEEERRRKIRRQSLLSAPLHDIYTPSQSHPPPSHPPHTSLPLHPHNPHLIRRWLMFWSGEVHGDSPLYILVGRRLPLALPCDHMVVVHFTLWVSGCAPVPGEV